jgi:hypothetical protein
LIPSKVEMMEDILIMTDSGCEPIEAEYQILFEHADFKLTKIFAYRQM